MERAQQAAMDSVREEYPKYFELLRMHPRQLVGKRVPATSPDEPGRDAEGFVVLKDQSDAESWMEASKNLLSAEANERALKQLEASRGEIDVVQRTIELFRKNLDIMPGTRGYNEPLLRRFLALAKPYEQRNETGGLLGYTVDVEKMLGALRTQMQEEQAAAPAPASAPAAAPPAPPAPVRQPQAGITSSASSGDSGEDDSTFWETLGVKRPMNL